MIDRSTSKEGSERGSRRAFLERAGKAGAAAAATTVVLATMKPAKASAHYREVRHHGRRRHH